MVNIYIHHELLHIFEGQIPARSVWLSPWLAFIESHQSSWSSIFLEDRDPLIRTIRKEWSKLPSFLGGVLEEAESA